MSFVIVGPEVLAAAASDLTSLGFTISAANAAAAAPTTGLMAAGAYEVSAAVAALFGAHGQAHQALSAQAAAFHQEFVRALSAGAGSYAGAEAAAASPLQSLLDPINAQVQAATGRPLMGNSTNGTPGTGQDGTPGGWLIGNGAVSSVVRGAGGTGGASGGGGVPIQEALQRANEKLLIGFTHVVGRLEQPLVPYLEQVFGPAVPPSEVPLPVPINGAVSLILAGTTLNVPPPDLVVEIVQQYNLPGGFGAGVATEPVLPADTGWAT